MSKILIIEDDKDIQEILQNYLEDAGYEVAIAGDGVEGIASYNDSFSLVLLDIMLPKIDGYGVCEVIRSRGNVPIIMLTALADEKNQVRGFSYKIDDYITKPFSAKVLLCKIKALLRRSGTAGESEKICYQELRLDKAGFHVYQSGREVILTQKEFELLVKFLENQGRVFTRQMLIDDLWGMDAYVEERIVDSHIKNLRKKLNVDYIETIRGVGYRIDKENKKQPGY